MMTLNYKRLGLAFGLTGTVLYLGCMILMVILGKSGTVQFFNSILHGLDVESIILMKVDFGPALIGLVCTFIIGWIIGALVASFYNSTIKL
jgi:hypothetical protein